MIYTVTLNPAVDRELTVPAIEFDSVLRATASRVDSGGKGFNVARALAALGADVTFVTGPADVPPPAGVRVARVETARDMLDAVQRALPADAAVFAAAVAGRAHGAFWDGLLGWLMRDPRFEPAVVELPAPWVRGRSGAGWTSSRSRIPPRPPRSRRW